MALPILHIFAAVINTYSLWYDQKYVNFPFTENLQGYPFRNRILFLTIWDLVLQTIYFWVAFTNDVVGNNEPSPRKPPLIRKIKDILFTIALPHGIYVSMAFWGIYAIDKELVLPERMAKVYPIWLNHIQHTLVSVFIIIEMLTAYITYPKRKLGVTLCSLFTLSYTAWLFIVYLQTGVWVYPILAFLNWPAKIMFISASTVSSLGLYFVGEKLNKSLCKPPVKSKNKRA